MYLWTLNQESCATASMLDSLDFDDFCAKVFSIDTSLPGDVMATEHLYVLHHMKS